MHTVSVKTLFRSKPSRAFIVDMRKAGVSERHSRRLARKLLLLAKPESVGRFVKTRAGVLIYSVDRGIKGGKIYVYKRSGGGGTLGGRAVVTFKKTRRRSKSTK